MALTVRQKKREKSAQFLEYVAGKLGLKRDTLAAQLRATNRRIEKRKGK